MDCCKASIENGRITGYKKYLGKLPYIGDRTDDFSDVKAAGYMLSTGMGVVTEGISEISDEVMKKIKSLILYTPEENNLTLKTIRQWTPFLESAKHYLICDSAYFNTLPAKSSTYAIPLKMRKTGARRYGGFGLCHENAWKKRTLETGKLISVYLGDRTNIAAIENGLPVDTTMGFTSLEGIPSFTSCGDIDPTIIFELHNKGMSFNEINKMLSLESGFSGLLEKRTNFYELLADLGNKNNKRISEILSYMIVKYIGAFAAVLGGVDSITFSAENPEAAKDYILNICEKLEFTGLKFDLKHNFKEEVTKASSYGSKTECLVIRFDKWKIMAEKMINVVKEA
jgi:acetate kinase